MCTLSIVSGGSDGFSVVMSRDEEQSRSAGLPPSAHELAGGVRALWPTDPDAGGTWVATASGHGGSSGTGLVLCLMNGNPTPRPARPENAVSRGTIIPKVIGTNPPDAWAVLARVRELALHRLAPFRLVGLSRQAFAAKGDKPSRVDCKLVSFLWSGQRAFEEILDPRKPRCFVSSGLGDELVQVRLPLFDERVGAAAPELRGAAQETFHRHQWAERTNVSVMMVREGARTVSITTCTLDERRATMAYEPV